MNESTHSITLALPCYNEEALLEKNLHVFHQYLLTLSLPFEILIINDGSKDRTGEIAEKFASERTDVRVIHHPFNMNIGNAIKTAFYNAKGSIVVVYDIDLSYSVEYIGQMVETLIQNQADIVVASPYMKGGKLVAVPFKRSVLSRWANKFMQFASHEKLHTFTGMTRAYRKSFIQTVNLKTKENEINPEILYKSIILRARIIEIPAVLDWTHQNKFAGKRTSSIKVMKGLFNSLMAGFIFRPYVFFWVIGSILMLLSLFELVWLLADTISDMQRLDTTGMKGELLFSKSLALNFKKNPQTFIVGGVTFIVALQFLSVGFISLQSKRYFEEMFHLTTSLRADIDKKEKN